MKAECQWRLNSIKLHQCQGPCIVHAGLLLCLTGTLQKNKATINVIRKRCAFPKSDNFYWSFVLLANHGQFIMTFTCLHFYILQEQLDFLYFIFLNFLSTLCPLFTIIPKIIISWASLSSQTDLIPACKLQLILLLQQKMFFNESSNVFLREKFLPLRWKKSIFW